MTKQFVIGVEIYQKPNGRFEVFVSHAGKQKTDAKIVKLIKNDDADEGHDDYEFYANAVCTAIREVV